MKIFGSTPPAIRFASGVATGNPDDTSDKNLPTDVREKLENLERRYNRPSGTLVAEYQRTRARKLAELQAQIDRLDDDLLARYEGTLAERHINPPKLLHR